MTAIRRRPVDATRSSLGGFLQRRPHHHVEARVIKIDPIDRRIGLSIKAAKMAEDEFKVDDSMLEGLRPGEDLVDLAGAFDAALGSADKPEEWSPGAGKKE